MKAGDPRSRIFVGQGFVVKPSLETAVRYVELLLKEFPQMIAMLEFTSKGRNHRQIDCALVGPGGIDLIEIKNKHGLVRGTPEGEWTVTSRGWTTGFSNTKNGVEENPFNQARNTSDDLKDWIKKDLGLAGVWVSPTVWLPSADPASVIEADSFVRHAVGTAALVSKIRPSTWQQSRWGHYNYRRLPDLFGLKPIDLAFVSGRVVESSRHAGLPDVRVIIEVDGQREETTTDVHGQFDFSVRKDSLFSVAFAVPGRFVQPEVLRSRATLDYQRVEPLILAERPSTKTEEEIRQEERQQVQHEVEARVNARLQRSQQEWVDKGAQMALVIEDLQAQLRDTLLRLDERERTLLKQLAEQKARQERLPLPVQVQQATQAVELQQQREQVTEALQHLSSRNEEQTQAVQRSLAVLSEVSAATRYALTQEATPALVVREVKVIETRPVPMPELEKVMAAEAEENKLDAHVPVEPSLPNEPMTPTPVPLQPGPVPQTAGLSSAPPRSRPVPVWPWLAGAVALVLGMGAFWQMQQGPAAQGEAVEQPAQSPALPGVSVDEVAPDEALPGVPVNGRP